MALVGQIGYAGQRDTAEVTQLLRSHTPRAGKHAEFFVSIAQPPTPGADFRRIPVRDVSFEYLLRVREAGLINEIPAEPWHSGKAPDNRAHVSLLRMQGIAVEIGILSGSSIGRESKKHECIYYQDRACLCHPNERHGEGCEILRNERPAGAEEARLERAV